MEANLSLPLKLAAGQRTGSKHLTWLSGMLQFSAATATSAVLSCSRKRSALVRVT